MGTTTARAYARRAVPPPPSQERRLLLLPPAPPLPRPFRPGPLGILPIEPQLPRYFGIRDHDVREGTGPGLRRRAPPPRYHPPRPERDRVVPRGSRRRIAPQDDPAIEQRVVSGSDVATEEPAEVEHDGGRDQRRHEDATEGVVTIPPQERFYPSGRGVVGMMLPPSMLARGVVRHHRRREKAERTAEPLEIPSR
jgi:hypothetical protein